MPAGENITTTVITRMLDRVGTMEMGTPIMDTTTVGDGTQTAIHPPIHIDLIRIQVITQAAIPGGLCFSTVK